MASVVMARPPVPNDNKLSSSTSSSSSFNENYSVNPRFPSKLTPKKVVMVTKVNGGHYSPENSPIPEMETPDVDVADSGQAHRKLQPQKLPVTRLRFNVLVSSSSSLQASSMVTAPTPVAAAAPPPIMEPKHSAANFPKITIRDPR